MSDNSQFRSDANPRPAGWLDTITKLSTAVDTTKNDEPNPPSTLDPKSRPDQGATGAGAGSPFTALNSAGPSGTGR